MLKRFIHLAAATCFAVALAASPLSPASAADWNQWRGPNHDGSTKASDLPVKFSKTENVKWMTPMPGPSAGTPIVVGDNVFVSSMDKNDNGLLAMCLDRGTGKVKWSHRVGTGKPTDSRANKASPSPVTDGKLVIYFYGTGDLAAFSVEGAKLWQQDITDAHGDFAFLWTFSSSPLLYKNKLYLQVLQRDTQVKGRGGKGGGPIPSFVLVIDPQSGKLIKKHMRPSKAKVESLEAFSTPIVHTRKDGSDEIVIIGGDCITGHDPDTMQELWRWGTWNPKRITHWRLVPSPVYGDGVFLACAPKKDPIYAVKANLDGDQSDNDDAILWSSDKRSPVTSDVCTPLFLDGKFYVLWGEGRDKTLTCVESRTGKIVWTGKLPGRTLYRSSPTGADGKIYTQNHKGEVVVIKAGGKKMEILHTAAMGDASDDQTRSSIAIAGSNLFIRTNGAVYCIGK